MNTDLEAGQRICVTGGSGFIGSHLVEQLIQAKHEVLSVGRTEGPSPGKCEWAKADIRSPHEIGQILRAFKPHVVYHLAALPDARESAQHMRDCVATNTVGTLNTFEAAADAGASLFVFGDSTKTYGNGNVPYRARQPESPICSYALAKAAGWRLCQMAAEGREIQICGIRPTFIYGPRQKSGLIQYVHDCFRRGEPVRLQGGKQTRDLLYVGDAVQAFIRVLHSPRAWGLSIPIGGGEERAVSDWCHAILEAFGSDLGVIEGADALRSTEIWRSYCDNLEASELLGWAPATGLLDGLRKVYPELPIGEAEFLLTKGAI